MNQEIKKEWVAALRSGEYKQGTGQLRHKDNFCCLGVLCDLHSKKTGKEWEGEKYDNMSGVLPWSIEEWAELTDDVGTFGKERANTLTKINDNGATFSEIADIIEANF